MIKTLLAASAFAALSVGAAQAASIVYASSATIIHDGPRGTANERDDITNAYGEADGAFFELGYGAVVDFYFESDFMGPTGTAVEVTFGTAASWTEGVIVEIGNTVNGVFTLVTTAQPNPLLNTGNGTFTFAGGPFNTVRLTDVTCNKTLVPGGKCDSRTGGFDVDAIGVAAVPLPAAGLLLLSAVGGVAALRRRKATAA